MNQGNKQSEEPSKLSSGGNGEVGTVTESRTTEGQALEASGEGELPSLRGILKESITDTVMDISCILIVYYLARALTAPPWMALACAAVALIVVISVKYVWKKKFNPISGLLVIFAIFSLIVNFATHDAKIVQIVNTIPGFMIPLAIVISLFFRTPLTRIAIEGIAPALKQGRLQERGWDDKDIRGWNAMHLRVSVIYFLVSFTLILIELWIVLSCSPDVAQMIVAIVPPLLGMPFLVYLIIKINNYIQSIDDQKTSA